MLVSGSGERKKVIRGKHVGAAPREQVSMNLRDDSGQALVIGALCMALLLGFVSLGVEVGMLFAQQQAMQTAADGAAITGAQESNYGDISSAAKADAARNGFTDGSSNVTVTVNSPPASGPNAGTANYVEVIISKQESTLFMSAFGHGAVTVSARSVAALSTTQNCIYTMNTTGTDISITNGAKLTMANCNIYGNSSSSSDLSMSGGASLSVGGIDLVGGSSITNGAKSSPTPSTGVTAVSDPLSYLSPPTYSSCTADPNIGGGKTTTIGPASGGTICYNSLSIGGGAKVTLQPGMYVINGVLSFNGGSTISGTGVTFYLPPGASLNIGNGTDFSLAAPTSGTYNGILFYQDPKNTTSEALEGGANSYLEGILYFPKANLTLENGTSTTSYESIVTGSLTMQGGATLKNYALKNKHTPMRSARIVE